MLVISSSLNIVEFLVRFWIFLSLKRKAVFCNSEWKIFPIVLCYARGQGYIIDTALYLSVISMLDGNTGMFHVNVVPESEKKVFSPIVIGNHLSEGKNNKIYLYDL